MRLLLAVAIWVLKLEAQIRVYLRIPLFSANDFAKLPFVRTRFPQLARAVIVQLPIFIDGYQLRNVRIDPNRIVAAVLDNLHSSACLSSQIRNAPVAIAKAIPVMKPNQNIVYCLRALQAIIAKRVNGGLSLKGASA
jgi:hypothetical protein